MNEEGNFFRGGNYADVETWYSRAEVRDERPWQEGCIKDSDTDIFLVSSWQLKLCSLLF